MTGFKARWRFVKAYRECFCEQFHEKREFATLQNELLGPQEAQWTITSLLAFPLHHTTINTFLHHEHINIKPIMIPILCYRDSA